MDRNGDRDGTLDSQAKRQTGFCIGSASEFDIVRDLDHRPLLPESGRFCFSGTAQIPVDKEALLAILEAAKPAIIICTRDRARSSAFYRDTLGLKFSREDQFAAVFELAGVTLRVSHVADFTPHEHTILGFTVPDVRAAVAALRENGVTFLRFPQFKHDDAGILALPDGKTHVAWFKDP